MRNFLTLFITLLTFGGTIAQVAFEPGYFIDNENNTIACLIQNEKWIESPKTVVYKLDENSQVLELNPDNCREFGIGEETIFKRIDAKIPITKSRTSDKNYSSEPILVEKRQFASLLLKGKISLYRVTNAGEDVFLTENSDAEIEVLLYKEYLDDDLTIRKNNLFKRQLLKNYACQNGPDIQSLKYTTKSMLDYFGNLNHCLGDSTFKVYRNKVKQKLVSSVSIKVWGGAQQNGYEARNLNTGEVFKFDDGVSIKGGVELEAFLGSLTKTKVSIFSGLQYSNVSNELSIPFDGLSESTLNLDVNVIELALGFRYYIGLGKKSDIFLDAAVVANFYSNPSLTETLVFDEIINRPPETNEFAPITRGSDIVPSLGIGYSFNKRFYLRATLLLDQNLIDNDGRNVDRDDLSQISLSLGYTLW
ncbi:MAG: hypothetical protein WBG90_19785 [Saonia sp.]